MQTLVVLSLLQVIQSYYFCSLRMRILNVKSNGLGFYVCVGEVLKRLRQKMRMKSEIDLLNEIYGLNEILTWILIETLTSTWIKICS
jgi:hypothetical protein